MLLQGCFQALNLSTHRSIIGRSTAQGMIRAAVQIHLGVISSVAHLPSRTFPFGKFPHRRVGQEQVTENPVLQAVRLQERANAPSPFRGNSTSTVGKPRARKADDVLRVVFESPWSSLEAISVFNYSWENRIPGPNTPTKRIRTTTAAITHGRLLCTGSTISWESFFHTGPIK
jgi:hypothetical protein